MKTVNLTIDNRPLTAVEGDILLWVALENDIYIQPLRNQRKETTRRQTVGSACGDRGGV